MALYEQEQGGKVIPWAGDLPEEAMLAIERAADADIIRHISDPSLSDAFLYSYPIETNSGKKSIIGISVDGAKEMAIMLGNIETLPNAKVEEKDEYFYGMVLVRELTKNVTLMGVARQCKFMMDKGNKPILSRPNEHAFTCAVTKAQRNGILSVVSQTVVIKIIEKFAADKKIKALPHAPHTEVIDQKSRQSARPDEKKAETAKKQTIVAPVNATPNYSAVATFAKEQGFTKEEMFEVLGVSSLAAKEWSDKGIDPNKAVETLRAHKQKLVDIIQANLLTINQASAEKTVVADKVVAPAAEATKEEAPALEPTASDEAAQIGDIKF